MTVPDPPIVDISTLSLAEILPKPDSNVTKIPSYTRRDLYEERQTPEAGIGAFATKDIPSGTRIFCEEGILMLPDEAGQVELYNAVKALDGAREKMFWELAASTKPSKNVEWIDEVRQICDEDISSTFNDLIASYEQAWSIYETNRFTCKPLDNDAEKSLGIFPQSARLNHSCSPNVFHRYNPVIDRLTVHALRDIKVGEELLTSYIDICHPTAVRRHILKHWGFRCRCSACDSPDDDEDYRRKKIEDLFAKINKRRAKKGKISEKDCRRSLGNVVKCIRLLKKEGMEETDTLGLVYAEGVRLGMMIGDEDEQESMVEWAEKAVEVERKCLGEDSKEFIAAVHLLESVRNKNKSNDNDVDVDVSTKAERS
ncbi:hypothetical protein TWF481_000058 [Arthrobotrys musiformis]|uniref:SET domain-containing protein n=1 Tax=Arthrobotrys musiformis TaxID=47236 RepID=A0AAV9WLP2_9PEZI